MTSQHQSHRKFQHSKSSLWARIRKKFISVAGGKYLKAFIVSLALTIAFIVSFWPIHATFHLDGQAERVHLILDKAPVFWRFKNARLYRNHSPKGDMFTGIYHPSASADVTVERISLGPLKLQCKSNSSGQLGTLSPDEGEQFQPPETIVGSSLVFVVGELDALAKDGETIVLPFL